MLSIETIIEGLISGTIVACAFEVRRWNSAAGLVERSGPGAERHVLKVLARLLIFPFVAIGISPFFYGFLIAAGVVRDTEDVRSEPLYVVFVVTITVGLWYCLSRFGPLRTK